MTAFISHSFENKPVFENVTYVLDQHGVPYWNPADIRVGDSLREQLRLAVTRCDLCIFIATRDAIASSWCGAELGAFWGAGKPIIVYVAEPSLQDDDLPQVVQGDVWEQSLPRIAKRAQEIVRTRAQDAGHAAGPAATSVAQLTVEQLQKMIAGAVSLAAAAAKNQPGAEHFAEVGTAAHRAAGKVLAGFQASQGVAQDAEGDWQRKVLWVDDVPANNVYERQAMEAMGLAFTLARSTQEALALLATHRFAAIISDMGRKEGPREGYALLQAVRAQDPGIPFFIYAGSKTVSQQREAAKRGAQGVTNRPDELVDWVARALPAGVSPAPG